MQVFGDLLYVNETVKLVLQLLHTKLSFAESCSIRSFRHPGDPFIINHATLLVPGHTRVCGTEGFELDLVLVRQDGVHLQAVLQAAGNMEGDAAALG